MKKRVLACFLTLLLALPVLATASGSVLMVALPQDAVMVEHVEFDDGDFIQTYQLSGGARVQLLRYATLDMELGDLIASEWVGCTDLRDLNVSEIGGHAAQGVRLCHQEEGQEGVDVTLVLVRTQDAELVFEAVFRQSIDKTQIDAQVQAMLDSMDVMTVEQPDETAEVG